MHARTRTREKKNPASADARSLHFVSNGLYRCGVAEEKPS